MKYEYEYGLFCILNMALVHNVLVRIHLINACIHFNIIL